MCLSKEIWKMEISKQEQFRKRCRPGMQNCTHTSYLSSYNLKTTIKVRKCSHVTTTSKLNQVFPTHQKMVIIGTDDYICFISLHTREVCKINTRNIFQPQLHFNWINFFFSSKSKLEGCFFISLNLMCFLFCLQSTDFQKYLHTIQLCSF